MTTKPESSALVDAFATYLQRVQLRAPRTVQNYRAVAGSLHTFLGSDQRVRDAETADLRQFLSGGVRTDVGSARATWNTKRSALRALYSYLTTAGSTNPDPTQDLERHRVPYRETSALSLAEMVSLVAAVERESTTTYRSRNVALVQVLMHTALRLSEVTGLKVQQIDLEERRIRSVRRKGNKVFDALFNDVCAEALGHYLADRPRLVRDDEVAALFVSDRGTALAKRTLQAMVTRYAKLAGIARPVSPHVLRHATATNLAALGTPITTIQQICGHSSVTTTQRYVHLASRERRDAIDSLGRAFRMAQRDAQPP